MKIGVCFDAKKAIDEFPTNADYIEVSGMLVNKLNTETYNRLKNAVNCGRLNSYSCNGLIDSSLRLTGKDVNLTAIKNYCDSLFYKLAELNIKFMVFGSGDARNIPNDFPRDAAREQLIELANLLADKAAPYGQTIAVETLAYKECNVLNTIEEGAEYVRAVGRDNFKLHLDFFHFDSNNEDVESIKKNKDIIVHAHFCAPKTRTIPASPEEWCFYEKCINALIDIDYKGNLSFEGIKPDTSTLDAIICEMKTRYSALTK